MNESRQESGRPVRKSGSTEMVTVFGYMLTVSYPLLALSTGVRALFQLLLKEDVVNYLAPTLSLLAALCYLTATIGFARRVPSAWRLSVGVLAFETTLTLLVGGLSFLIPDVSDALYGGILALTTAISPSFNRSLGLSGCSGLLSCASMA